MTGKHASEETQGAAPFGTSQRWQASVAVPEAPVCSAALVVPDHGLSQKPWPPDWTYAQAYLDLIIQGKTPAVVLEGRANDENYLKARGITELIPLAKVKG